MALVDYFLKLDGIKGESKDHKHKDEIQLESWSWGASNSGSHGAGGGGGAGKVAMQDIHLVKKMDLASPILMLACADGRHIKEAHLTARKAGGNQEEYLKIKFTDLLISSYQTGGSAAGEIVPTDQISLNFSKIEFSYSAQDEKGKLSSPQKSGWDLKANKKL